jgi:hypothetical protein
MLFSRYFMNSNLAYLNGRYSAYKKGFLNE